MRRNLRPYGYSPSAPEPEGGPPQRGMEGVGGLRSPRFIAGMSLVLAFIAVAVAITALVVALDANSPEDVADRATPNPNAYTVDVVDRAVRYYQEYGWSEAAEYYLTPWSVDGTWHVFMVNPEDRFVASQDNRCSATASGAWEETTGATAGATSKSLKAGDGCTRMPGTRSPGGPRSATRGSCAMRASCLARPGTSRGALRGVVGELAIALDQSAASSLFPCM